jgi:hypothetical protein
LEGGPERRKEYPRGKRFLEEKCFDLENAETDVERSSTLVQDYGCASRRAKDRPSFFLSSHVASSEIFTIWHPISSYLKICHLSFHNLFERAEKTLFRTYQD